MPFGAPPHGVGRHPPDLGEVISGPLPTEWVGTPPISVR
jgi:hypothetical protein